MDIRSCKFCRKYFSPALSDLCPQCAEELDDKYIKIRNYLDRNPARQTRELAEGADVDEKTVLYLIREGRLELSSGAQGLHCASCGANISTGRYCDNCKRRVAQQVELARRQGTLLTPPESESKPKGTTGSTKSRVHILNDRKER